MSHSRPAVWTLLDRRDVADWLSANEQQVAAFQAYLRTLNPHTWQQEFVHIILESADIDDGDEPAEAKSAD